MSYKTFVNNVGVNAAKYLIWFTNNQNKSSKRSHKSLFEFILWKSNWRASNHPWKTLTFTDHWKKPLHWNDASKHQEIENIALCFAFEGFGNLSSLIYKIYYQSFKSRHPNNRCLKKLHQCRKKGCMLEYTLAQNRTQHG